MSVGTVKELGSSADSRSNFSFDRETRASFAPCFARSFAVARPIPEEAPVMITT